MYNYSENSRHSESKTEELELWKAVDDVDADESEEIDTNGLGF